MCSENFKKIFRFVIKKVQVGLEFYFILKEIFGFISFQIVLTYNDFESKKLILKNAIFLLPVQQDQSYQRFFSLNN